MQDLHLHLSGATPPSVLWEIVRESGLKTGAKDYWAFESTVIMNKDKVKDLDDYLSILHTIDLAQSSPLAIDRSVFSAYKSSYLAGTRYLELRWNPVKRSQKGRIDLDSLIVAARAGYERAHTMYGIEGGMILCMGRDCTPEENAAIFKKALQYEGKGVIGIDVAGPETTKLPSEFAHYYAAANSSKMITTCHVGETDHKGVEEELEFVLEKLVPTRIGHGIQIVKFPKLLKKAVSMGVHFELCISSNLMSRAVERLEDFKPILQALEEAGAKFNFNTDATYPLSTDIKNEQALSARIKEIP